MLAKRHHLFTAAAATLALGCAGATAHAADIFSLNIDDVQGRQNNAEEGRQQPSQCADQSELRRRQRLAAILLDRRAGGHQELRVTMFDPEGRGGAGVSHWVAYGIPAPSPALPRAKSASLRTNMSAARAARRRHLFRSVHAAQHHAAPLYVRSRRHRLRSEGTAARPDPRRGDREDRAAPPAHVKGSTGLVGLFVNPWKM